MWQSGLSSSRITFLLARDLLVLHNWMMLCVPGSLGRPLRGTLKACPWFTSLVSLVAPTVLASRFHSGIPRCFLESLSQGSCLTRTCLVSFLGDIHQSDVWQLARIPRPFCGHVCLRLHESRFQARVLDPV